MLSGLLLVGLGPGGGDVSGRTGCQVGMPTCWVDHVGASVSDQCLCTVMMKLAVKLKPAGKPDEGLPGR